ncbi:hypothetical protein [Pontixanthobacter luteolus]|uniref:hypothetical protein n=1 Tax=Pontixanthobacter luteolus TaxID=295089 RepID=UPI0023042167|nr:hypothetical protein [Pontixanthobacter luteolus]
MGRIRFLSAAALALASCGGGDSSSGSGGSTGGGTGGGSTGGGSSGGGGGGSSGGTPTPTISYTKFAELTGDRSFNTACTLIVRSGASTSAPAATSFGDGLTYIFDESADTYSITASNLNLTFAPADLASEDAQGFRYEKANANGGQPDTFIVFNPGITVQPTDYARVSRVITAAANGSQEDYRCVFGVPTELEDSLPAGTVSYSQYFTTGTAFLEEVGGNLRAFNLRSTELSFAANPSNGAVDFTLTVKGTESGTATVSELATFSGSTSIDGTNQSFDGLLADGNNVATGSFGGWFFGPQGAEIAFAWGADIRRDDGSRIIFAANTVGSNP